MNALKRRAIIIGEIISTVSTKRLSGVLDKAKKLRNCLAHSVQDVRGSKRSTRSITYCTRNLNQQLLTLYSGTNVVSLSTKIENLFLPTQIHKTSKIVPNNGNNTSNWRK